MKRIFKLVASLRHIASPVTSKLFTRGVISGVIEAAGLGLVAYGLGLIFLPLAFIFGGLFLTLFGWSIDRETDG